MDNVTEFKKDVEKSEDEFGKNEMTLERQAEGASGLIEKIEVEQARIDENNELAKAKNAPIRDNIAKIKQECRDDYGIEAKALQTILTKRRQERRMEDRIEALEDHAREQFDQIELNFA